MITTTNNTSTMPWTMANGSSAGGTVRFSVGDSYCITFAEAAQAMAGQSA
jgi:hypothetical protein